MWPRKKTEASEAKNVTDSSTNFIKKFFISALSKISKNKPQVTQEDSVAPINIIQQESISLDKIDSQRVPMAGTGYLNDKCQALYTEGLASCYALIVVGRTAKGTPIASLTHWIGDEQSAEDTILNMKKVLKTQGGKVSEMQCFAIGGQKDFSDMTQEIESLVKRKILNQAKVEVNEHGENSNLIVRLNDNMQLCIEYSTTKNNPNNDKMPVQQEDKHDVLASALAALRKRSP